MWGDRDADKRMSVKTVKLSRFIGKQVDLLKLDVEGSEERVMKEIRHKLNRIKELRIEYHGTRTTASINNLEVIEEILKDANFDVKLKKIDAKKCFTEEYLIKLKPVICHITAVNKDY